MESRRKKKCNLKQKRKYFYIVNSLIGLFLLCIIIGSKVYKLPYTMLRGYLEFFYTEDKYPGDSKNPLKEVIHNKSNNAFVDLENLHSSYAILIDGDLGNIISEKSSKEKIYPASLTKIMTALIIIENIKHLEQPITIAPDIFTDLYEQNASRAGFMPNETVKAKDLLYGVLLPSGAECCITLANYISGSEDSFVNLMNQKTKELGMKNTHFTNSTGLHERAHYSTVEDISILLNYAIKDKVFYEVFTSKRYSTAPTNCHKDGITFYSTMFQNMENFNIEKDKVLGGKTGYTQQAGLCLASISYINGKNYIFVSAKAKGTHETEPYHILDAINVYNQVEKQ